MIRYGVRGQSKSGPTSQLVLKPELIEQPEPVILAFDIECTKMPLKFPTAASDQVPFDMNFHSLIFSFLFFRS